MNLEKMIRAQSDLDNSIREIKGLQDKDLVANTFVALQVELAEMANEARWFKHWSDDQEPRDYCKACQLIETEHVCTIPLLEEFSDGVHFFLSLAIQKGWEDSLYIHEEAIMDLKESGLDGGLTGIYLELMYFLNMSHQGANKKIFGKPEDEYYFSMAWFLFIGMGMVGFSFTENQIEQAYFEKNKINYKRQKSGY